ncbi:MAG: hypothetical protein HYY25_10630 [Candidatus Wallbacteria bacterium]|nr:hypothetical protein [Candidatus Wallbacteria bacterium]
MKVALRGALRRSRVLEALALAVFWLAGALPCGASDGFDALIARYGGGFTTFVEGEQAEGVAPGIALRDAQFGLQPGRGLKLEGRLLVRGRDTGRITAVIRERMLWLTLMNERLAYVVPIEGGRLPPETYKGLELLADGEAASRVRAAVDTMVASSERPGELVFDRAQPPGQIVLTLDPSGVPAGVRLYKHGAPQAVLRLRDFRADTGIDLGKPIPDTSYSPRSVEQLSEVPRQLGAVAESAKKAVDAVKQGARSFMRRLFGGGQ